MSKIRITTYDKHPLPEEPYLIIKEDRLVEMSTEFRNGPKEKHQGPIRIETTLFNTFEVEGLITYLRQLAADLPIQEKAQRTHKTSKTQIMKEDSIAELIQYVKNSPKLKTQEDTIEYLRGLNFVFLTVEHFTDIMGPIDGRVEDDGSRQMFIKHKHRKYQVMIRQLKLAKNPINDKYDPQIFFLFKLIGTKVAKFQVYVNGMHECTIKREWKEIAEIGAKVKEKFYKFGPEMDYDERAKWRTEDRRKQANPNYEPTKFYYKWLPYVTILQPQKKKEKK